MYLEGTETDDEKSQVFREFKTQQADFESKGSSETASEANQPSMYRRSDNGTPAQLVKANIDTQAAD